MLVSEVFSQVDNYFDAGGFSASGTDLTNSMGYFWINKAVTHYWRKLLDQNFGYFQLREQTLAITAGTAVYALPNASTTTATTSASVAFVSNVFLRGGSSAPYTYLKVEPTYANDRFYLKMSNLLFPVPSVLQNQSGFTWSSNVGSLDGSGRPTWSVEFSPTPSTSGTVVLDGWRYPALVSATTDHIDLPDHIQFGVIYHVLRDAYLRDKADLTEINNMIEKYDSDIFMIEKRGVQNDGSLTVKEVR